MKLLAQNVHIQKHTHQFGQFKRWKSLTRRITSKFQISEGKNLRLENSPYLANWETIKETWIGREYILVMQTLILSIYRVFFHWYPPKKLKYGKPRLGESTLTLIGLDTPYLAKINFFVLLGGVCSQFWHKICSWKFTHSTIIFRLNSRFRKLLRFLDVWYDKYMI